MNEYLLSIKAIIDSLISIGNKITPTEHIENYFGTKLENVLE